MELYDAIIKRRSIRKYTDKQVPDDVLNRILEAARLAPSGRNEQLWRFVVVRDEAQRQKLMQAANNQPWVGQAPVVIAAVALDPVRHMMCDVPAYAVNMGIAMEHVALAATNEGLGTCWIGNFSQDLARETLGIPDKYKIAALMPMGYAAEEPDARPRKSLEEITSYDTFKE
jgi:nitroreductase